VAGSDCIQDLKFSVSEYRTSVLRHAGLSRGNSGPSMIVPDLVCAPAHFEAREIFSAPLKLAAVTA